MVPHEWIKGSGNNLDSGEVVEFTVGVERLSIHGTALASNKTFKIEVIPASGAVVSIERTTPLEIITEMDMD